MIGDNQLNRIVGSWAGPEELFQTAWTAAGTADGTLTVRRGPGDALLLDYEGRSDAATLTGHGVVVVGSWWWFDSFGFIPTVPGTARWDGNRLILERASERGRTLTTVELGDGRLEQCIDTAVPADAELTPLMRGTYTPVPHGNPGSD